LAAHAQRESHLPCMHGGRPLIWMCAILRLRDLAQHCSGTRPKIRARCSMRLVALPVFRVSRTVCSSPCAFANCNHVPIYITPLCRTASPGRPSTHSHSPRPCPAHTPPTPLTARLKTSPDAQLCSRKYRCLATHGRGGSRVEWWEGRVGGERPRMLGRETCSRLFGTSRACMARAGTGALWHPTPSLSHGRH